MIKLRHRVSGIEYPGFLYDNQENTQYLLLSWFGLFIGLKVVSYHICFAEKYTDIKIKDIYSDMQTIRTYRIYLNDIIINAFDGFIVIDKEDIRSLFDVCNTKEEDINSLFDVCTTKENKNKG